MGVSKAYITQLLSGSRNMTLWTFANAAYHCGQKVLVNYVPIQEKRDRQKAHSAFEVQGLLHWFLAAYQKAEMASRGVRKLGPGKEAYAVKLFERLEEHEYPGIEQVRQFTEEEIEECYAAAG
jgi:hypothetical protein